MIASHMEYDRDSQCRRQGKREREHEKGFELRDSVRESKRSRDAEPTMESVYSNPHLRQVYSITQWNALVYGSAKSFRAVVSRSCSQTVATNRELTSNSTECWSLTLLARSIDGVKVS